MSIEQTSQIDYIGIERESNRVVLTISDTLSWDEEYAHLQAIQEKLNCYLRFCESGEILESYPDAEGKDIVIEIKSMNGFPEIAEQFLTQARTALNEAGFDLRWT